MQCYQLQNQISDSSFWKTFVGECPVLEKVRMQTLGFARTRLSGIVALGKEAGLLNSFL